MQTELQKHRLETIETLLDNVELPKTEDIVETVVLPLSKNDRHRMEMAHKFAKQRMVDKTLQGIAPPPKAGRLVLCGYCEQPDCIYSYWE